MNVPVLRPPIPAAITPRHILHKFTPSLLIIGASLMGWVLADLKTLSAEPGQDPRYNTWASTSLRLELLSGERFRFTYRPGGSDFLWADVGESITVAARFKRHGRGDTPSCELVEVRREMLVAQGEMIAAVAA
jgi:hypothetical protein